MKKFTKPELIFIAIMAFLNFLILIIFEALFGRLHIPPFPIMFIVAMNFVLMRFIVDKFWTLTLGLLIFSALATFTPIWGGVPGFHKLPIALIAGIITDTALSLTKRRSYLFRGILYGLLNGLIVFPLMTYTVFFFFHTPLSQKMLSFIVILTIVEMVIEAFGGILAAGFYKKIKNWRVVRMIEALRRKP